MHILSIFLSKRVIPCTLYIVHCTLYSVQCILYIVHCTMYSVHSNIRIYPYKLQIHHMLNTLYVFNERMCVHIWSIALYVYHIPGIISCFIRHQHRVILR